MFTDISNVSEKGTNSCIETSLVLPEWDSVEFAKCWIKRGLDRENLMGTCMHSLLFSLEWRVQCLSWVDCGVCRIP